MTEKQEQGKLYQLLQHLTFEILHGEVKTSDGIQQAGLSTENKAMTHVAESASLKTILDEAKDEFLEAANTDTNYLTINRNEIAIQDWFKKWFGE
jgi:hypothetical protein